MWRRSRPPVVVRSEHQSNAPASPSRSAARKMSPESIAKHAETARKSPEIETARREKIAAALRGKPKSPERNAKVSEALRGKKRSPESIARQIATRKLAYLHHEFTRHKRPVWYFRRGKGKRICIPGEFGSIEFSAAYDAALNGARPERQGPAHGSFGWGMRQYRLSQAWLALSPATQRQRINIFKHVEKSHPPHEA
jgi:hypothetical protein